MKRLIVTSLALIIALGLLSASVCFYCFSGVHVADPIGATDYHWLPRQMKTNMTEGFSWLRLDNNGYNNFVDGNDHSTDILVMGSSHMEAMNVGRNAGTSAVLSSLLPDYSVYNIGVSGHEIYQCAKNLRNAVGAYHPEKYVIVETATISLDKDKIEKVLAHTMGTIPSYDSGVVFYAQRYCPAIKTIYKNLADWRAVERTHSDTVLKQRMDPDLLRRFLEYMQAAMPDKCQLIIMYHPAVELECDGSLVLKTKEDDLGLFQTECAKSGVLFVDTSRAFETLYEEQHILPYGFSNTAVGSGHLNKYGHRAIAIQLAETIKENAYESK